MLDYCRLSLRGVSRAQCFVRLVADPHDDGQQRFDILKRSAEVDDARTQRILAVNNGVGEIGFSALLQPREQFAIEIVQITSCAVLALQIRRNDNGTW